MCICSDRTVFGSAANESTPQSLHLSDKYSVTPTASSPADRSDTVRYVSKFLHERQLQRTPPHVTAYILESRQWQNGCCWERVSSSPSCLLKTQAASQAPAAVPENWCCNLQQDHEHSETSYSHFSGFLTVCLQTDDKRLDQVFCFPSLLA